MGRPFRALHLWGIVTQGFTLGWDMPPLQGLESARLSGAALYSTFVATCFRRHPEA
jgi:hypothetical protein